MKKTFYLWGVLAAVLFVTGCGTTSSATGSSSGSKSSRPIGKYGEPAPDWMVKGGLPDTADMVYFVGNGRNGKTITARKGTARADGLQQLATWKEGRVSATLKDYVEEQGETGNTQSLESFKNAVLARSKANTSGFREVESWTDADDTIAMLFSYPVNDLRKDFKDATNEFVRNESATFAEFKADQMFKQLEKELEP